MNQIKKFKKNEGDKWVQKATYRKENKTWLSYSRKIALRILSAMEDIPNMNQRVIAESLGVSPQHINKIIKGQENLTLQTIAKFSEILKVDLIVFPSFKYNYSMNILIDIESNKSAFLLINKNNTYYVNSGTMFSISSLLETNSLPLTLNQ